VEEGDLKAGYVLRERYRIVDRLGAGGFGTVWRAVDERTSLDVAVKVLHLRGTNAAAFEKQQERFLTEGAILERLDHPNIVRTLGRFLDGDRACLITELHPGITLRDVMLKRAEGDSEIRLDELDLVLRPLSAALVHAHDRGVVHRDFKPQNIMLTEKGGELSVRVLDFGIARVTRSDEADATTVGRLLGTLLYMSPEQFTSPLVGPPCDQFAFASLLFEIMTLRWAWAREGGAPMRIAGTLRGSDQNGYATILQRITSGPRPSASALRPDLPQEIDAVFDRAWAVAPEERYPTVAAFASALRGVLEPLLADRTTVRKETTQLTLLRGMDSAPMARGLDLASMTGPERLQSALLPRDPRARVRVPGPVIGAGVALVIMGGGLGVLALRKALLAPPMPSPAPVVAQAPPVSQAPQAVVGAVPASPLPVASVVAAPVPALPMRKSPAARVAPVVVDVAPVAAAPARPAVSPERRSLGALDANFDSTAYRALLERLRDHPRVRDDAKLRAALDRVDFLSSEDALKVLHRVVDAIDPLSSPPR